MPLKCNTEFDCIHFGQISVFITKLSVPENKLQPLVEMLRLCIALKDKEGSFLPKTD